MDDVSLLDVFEDASDLDDVDQVHNMYQLQDQQDSSRCHLVALQPPSNHHLDL